VRSLKLQNQVLLDKNSAPYFTAEINTGHFGKYELALKAIDAAKAAGCDCIKFQSWAPESLYTRKYLIEHRIEHRMFKHLSLDAKQLKDLTLYCTEVGIDFCSTPYSFKEIDELVENANLPFIKIASMEINNHEFLEYAGKTGVPIVLSTGMADLNEIGSAVESILSTGNTQIALLHCTSIYPTPDADLNLLNISKFMAEFPELLIGFSDHSLGLLAAPIAVGLGARLIEKHFTLDKSKPGFDNAMALNVEELATLVADCKNAAKMLGNEEREISLAEVKQREVMRRSIYLTRDITAGEKFDETCFEFKRPGTGVEPNQVLKLIGKTAAHNLSSGDPIDFGSVRD